MRNIKLTIEYDGTNYCGWQKQTNDISIQEVIEKALKKILRQNIGLIGAGRTDSGVHAQGQVASFETSSKLTTREFLFALNTNLPKDIAIRKVQEVVPDFNARFNARCKLYRYDIFNDTIPSPFERRYSYQYRLPLNIGLMKKGAKVLIGRHNFRSFQASDRRKRPSISEIKKITIKRRGKHIYIDIEAKGFLYNMARNIIGTLIEIGRGKLRENDMKKILKSKNRALAGPTAPAKGLCLMKVNY